MGFQESGERSPCLSGQESALCACGTFLHELALQLGAERCFSVISGGQQPPSPISDLLFFPLKKWWDIFFFRLNTEEFKGL